MSELLDKIPYVPKLTKFLIIFDLNQGVRITTLVLIILQAISAVIALFSIGKHGGLLY